jgi:hypothetical protein
LVEEGFEATLVRKYNSNSARPRIFDGATEAKLIALACSPAPDVARQSGWGRRRSGMYFDGRGGLMIVAARQDCKLYFVGAQFICRDATIRTML